MERSHRRVIVEKAKQTGIKAGEIERAKSRTDPLLYASVLTTVQSVPPTVPVQIEYFLTLLVSILRAGPPQGHDRRFH